MAAKKPARKKRRKVAEPELKLIIRDFDPDEPA